MHHIDHMRPILPKCLLEFFLPSFRGQAHSTDCIRGGIFDLLFGILFSLFFLDFGLIGVTHQGPFRSLIFPPVLRDWVIKGFGMSSLVYATGHIKNPMPLVEKSRGLSPGGRFPPSFMHQVIIITGLNKLQLYVLALKMALDADRA